MLKGTGTLRVLRQLHQPNGGWDGSPWRAWDIALRCGVSPQGVAGILDRLREAGLVKLVTPARNGRAATYRLNTEHPYYKSFAYLFGDEARLARQADRDARHAARHAARRLQRHPPDP